MSILRQSLEYMLDYEVDTQKLLQAYEISSISNDEEKEEHTQANVLVPILMHRMSSRFQLRQLLTDQKGAIRRDVLEDLLTAHNATRVANTTMVQYLLDTMCNQIADEYVKTLSTQECRDLERELAETSDDPEVDALMKLVKRDPKDHEQLGDRTELADDLSDRLRVLFKF